jgi:hypothetical protein
MPISTRPLVLALSLLAMGAVHTNQARAATFCADDTTELVFALASAAQSAEDDEVRVRSGTFALTSNVTLTFNGALALRGGWSLGCLVQSNNPGASVISSSTPGSFGMVLRPRDGDLTVERLTFDRLDGLVLQDLGTSASVVADIHLQRSRFIDNDFGPLVRPRDKRVRIENNIITGSGQRALQIQRESATAPLTVDAHNNTIVGSSEGIRVTGTLGTVRLRNNVIDGNDLNPGIVIVDGVVTVNHNSLDGGFTYIGGGSASPAFDNDLVIDPMFDAAFVPQAGSPLINSGSNAIPGGLPSVDFAGSPRRIGSRVDRGARESTVSDVATLTVTTTADSGAGSLRQAIIDANVTAIEETIAFDIAGACPRIISLATTLPAISNALTIDGFTQPGASPNTVPDSDEDGDDSVHCIALSGNGTNILSLTPAAEQEIRVRGLAFYGATASQIRVNGAGRATIVGNTFSTGTTVFELDVPQYAINVDGSDGTIIGHPSDKADRNIIGRASVAGIRLGPGYGRSIERNFIGIGKSGSNDVGNGIGVLLIDSQFDSVDGNYIGFNESQGVQVEGALSQMNIQRNSIGRSQGGIDAGNGGDGIRLVAGVGFFLRVNTIHYNGGDGISVLGDVRDADIGNNFVSMNGGLGIDLAPNGVNPIDTDTGATGANDGQNFPTLTAAFGGENAGQVFGELRSANGQYEIGVYANGSCDASGHGEGRIFIGGGTVTVDNGNAGSDGVATFVIDIDSDSLAAVDVTALARRYGGPDPGGTSEYSACIEYQIIDLFSDGFEEE